MPRGKTPTREGRGAPSNRVLFAQEQLAKSRFGAARQAVMTQFGVSRTSATRDLAEAQRLMSLEAEQQRPYLRARAIARLEALMDKAEAAGKYEAAIRAQRELTRITGIAAPEHVVHHEGGAPGGAELYEDMTDEQLELLEKVLAPKATVQ